MIIKDETIEKLKAYFSERFMSISDVTHGGCETCGYGGIEAATIEAIRDALDDFKKHELYKSIPSIINTEDK